MSHFWKKLPANKNCGHLSKLEINLIFMQTNVWQQSHKSADGRE